MDASPSLTDCVWWETGDERGASQSTASSAKVVFRRSNHFQTEAPKWIVRRMAWTLQRT